MKSAFSDFLRHIVLRSWELKTELIFGPFFPPLSTHAGLSPPHKSAISLFNREKGVWGGNGGGGKKGPKQKIGFQFPNAKNYMTRKI
jgi:hypothetical protein